MAQGLSLVCGDCGVQLRSTTEAQDHAEITSHANFVESTEAVLNLVCIECGKPCRSKTETDLHTKRTGHARFEDKTNEAAKPIELVAEMGSGVARKNGPPGSAEVAGASVADGEGASGEGGPGASEEMVAPAVNQEVQAELEAMGFSAARAIRALHFSGNTSVEGAVNWIVEHEDDPDIDEMPMVKAGSAENKKAMSAEEARVKAQELREKARKKKEEEEKRMEREREKERIRVGKEILEAKRIEEDQERKRIIALKKAEKEEERRARERIKAKIEEDRAERRRKLGLPPEEPKKEEEEEGKAVPMEVDKKKTALPVRPASQAEKMRGLLRGLKHNHQQEDARVKKAFQTLLTFIGNVAQRPDEDKYRKIRLTNAAFMERVGSMTNGVAFLELCGFEKDETGETLVMARDKVDPVLLNTAGAELTSALSNPFFGVLK